MKGGGGGGSGASVFIPAKRRWRWLVIGVLGLVILSMLVPLVFLLGLYNGFHAPGYASDTQNSKSDVFQNYAIKPQKEVKDFIHDSQEVKDFKHDSQEDKVFKHDSKEDKGFKHDSQEAKGFKHDSPEVKGFKHDNQEVKGSKHDSQEVKGFKHGEEKGLHLPKVDTQPTKSTGLPPPKVDTQPTKSTGLPPPKVDTQPTKSTGLPPPKVDTQPTKSTGLQAPKVDTHPTHSHENSTKVGGRAQTSQRMIAMDESGKPCEWKFGSYCIWRQENREVIKDSMVKKLKDQLFVARSYYPTIAKLPDQTKLSSDMKQHIQDLERVLSESTTDLDLPAKIEEKSVSVEAAITKAKTFPVDCNNVDKKLRQIFDMTEDEANFHMKQSAFLFQLAVQTMPKSLHCLYMQLTVEYFSGSTNLEASWAEKYADPTLNHYVIFSTNILASSVVINSTVIQAKESGNQVFHVLTDGENFFAMKLWFLRNSYKEATVEVLNIEHYILNDHENATLILPQEFRVSFRTLTHSRTEYISMFSHSYYLLPEIFKNLEKVVVLEDDVVVQKDLSALWSIDMGGKVNGAVQFCQVKLGELKSFLGENGYDQNECSWISGLNVIDLAKWRELDLSKTFHSVVRKKGRSTDAAALRASLLTFQGKVYALDDSWSLYGLGHDHKLNDKDIENAATLHYNGYLKPWLELGVPKYKAHWKKFLNRDDVFLSKCNINT